MPEPKCGTLDHHNYLLIHGDFFPGQYLANLRTVLAEGQLCVVVLPERADFETVLAPYTTMEFKAIIVDIDSVALRPILAILKKHFKRTKIFVATRRPNVEDCRQYFLMGASDYLHLWEQNCAGIRDALETALARKKKST